MLPAEKLMDFYYKSVGRNSNLLLGIVVDDRGLIPEKDAAQLCRLGAMLKRRFANKVAGTSGQGTRFVLPLKPRTRIDHIVLRENLKNGHAVRAFFVELLKNGKAVKTFRAKAIGNKRIFRFPAAETDELCLTIQEYADTPEITEFSCFLADDFSLREKIRMRFDRQ